MKKRLLEPGIAPLGVADPGIHALLDFVPLHFASGPKFVHVAETTPHADHALPLHPCALGSNPPAEKRDAIGGPVNAALAFMEA